MNENLLAEENAIRLRSLIKTLGLPVFNSIEPADLFEAILKDKKKRGARIGLVLLEDLGTSVIKYIELDSLKSVLDDLHLYST